MHINQKKNIIQTMHESNNNDNHISWQDQTLSGIVNNSQIIMNLEEQCSQAGERLYESAHVDSLLETSFVQLDKLEEKLGLTDQNPNFESGDSFFQKSNNIMCRTELGSKKLKRMKNKKLQCNIGCGGREEPPSAQPNLLSKMRRLQILKIIKLLRVLFKSVRSSHIQVKEQVKAQMLKSQQFFQKISSQVLNMQKHFIDALGCKNLRILELQQDLEQTVKMNSKLLDRIERNKRQSQRIIIQMVEDKQKSLAEINDASVTASIKAEQFEEQNEKLKKQIDFFQTRAENLEERANDNQILIKKLQYENEKLTIQNQQYSARQDQLLRQLQSLSDSNGELTLQLENISEQMITINRVNQLYQKQLQSTKKQLKKSQQANFKLLRQCQTKIQHTSSRQPQKVSKIKGNTKFYDPNQKNLLNDRENKLQQHDFVFKSIQQKDTSRSVKLSQYLRLKTQTKLFCSSDGIMRADLQNLLPSCNSNPDKETYSKNID